MPGHGFSGAPALKATRADVDAALANTAAISELAFTIYANNSESANQSDYIFVAPFPLKVVSCAAVFSTSQTGTATDRWTYFLRRLRAGVVGDIASKSNWGGDGAGGASIQPNIEWNFDGRPFDTTNQVFLKGDACTMLHVSTGTLGSGGFVAFTRRAITVRYEPL